MEQPRARLQPVLRRRLRASPPVRLEAMCGIVGYIGAKPAVDVVLEGLRRLEYRGYDSAGIAVIDGDLRVSRKAGKLDNLEAALADVDSQGHVGIGHTRWATHGA